MTDRFDLDYPGCIGEAAMKHIEELLKTTDPAHIVEFGGGRSTARLARLFPSVRIDSYEHSVSYLSKTASLIESLHAQHAYCECVIGHTVHRVGAAASELRRCLDALAHIPPEGTGDCHDHGLCCGAARQHRSLPELVLTTARGLSLELHRHHWSENHRYVVVGAAGVTVPAECRHHEHCGCRPWMELPAAGDVLAELPRRWARACHVA